ETRIIKNSSKLAAKMARNLTRSRRGWRSSRASSRTRQLNCNQLSSRLIYRDGSSKSTVDLAAWCDGDNRCAGIESSVCSWSKGWQTLLGIATEVYHARTQFAALLSPCMHRATGLPTRSA